jgi:hypothetical protein
MKLLNNESLIYEKSMADFINEIDETSKKCY